MPGGGSAEVKELCKQINDYISKAENILEKLPNPNKETLTRLFKSEIDLFKNNKTDIIFLFEEQIALCKKEERIKTAHNGEHALRSLKKYMGAIFFEVINKDFLKGYKTWMVSQGNPGDLPPKNRTVVK